MITSSGRLSPPPADFRGGPSDGRSIDSAALTEDATAVSLGTPAPHALFLAPSQGVLEAAQSHIAAGAHGLRRTRRVIRVREEEQRVQASTGALIPPLHRIAGMVERHCCCGCCGHFERTLPNASRGTLGPARQRRQRKRHHFGDLRMNGRFTHRPLFRNAGHRTRRRLVGWRQDASGRRSNSSSRTVSSASGTSSRYDG